MHIGEYISFYSEADVEPLRKSNTRANLPISFGDFVAIVFLVAMAMFSIHIVIESEIKIRKRMHSGSGGSSSSNSS